MRKLLGPLAAFLVALTGGAALAQDYTTFESELNEIRANARLRIGPVRMLPEFRLTNVGYDDNVYFRTAEQGPVGDYVGTASLEAGAFLLLGRSLILSFMENPEYLYFAKQKPLRKFTNSYEPAARLRLFNRLVFSGSYHFLRHQRQAYSEFTALVTDTDKGVDMAAFYETPRGSALGFLRSVERFQFEDVRLPEGVLEFSRSLDRRETTNAIALYYPVFSGSSLFLTVGSTRYEFDYPESRWKDSGSTQGSAGIRFPLMGRARGRLSVGYKKFDPDIEGRKGFSGLVADTDLDFRIGRFGLRFGVGRDSRFSYLEDVLFYVEDSVRPGLTFRLTRRFRLDYEFLYQRLEYPGSPVASDPGDGPAGIDRRDTLRTHLVGFTVFFLGNTGLRVSYNIFERISSAPGFGRRKNFIGVSLIRDF